MRAWAGGGGRRTGCDSHMLIVYLAGQSRVPPATLATVSRRSVPGVVTGGLRNQPHMLNGRHISSPPEADWVSAVYHPSSRATPCCRFGGGRKKVINEASDLGRHTVINTERV